MSVLKTTVNFLPSWEKAADPGDEIPPTERAKRLPILIETKSNSELSTFLACQVRHHFSYGLRRKPRVTSEALSFGTLWHLGMAAWWKPEYRTPEDRLIAGVEAFTKPDVNPYMLETLTQLLIGYTARWADAPYTAIAIEQEFTTPLVNPDTGETHPTIGLLGIIDKIVLDASGIPHVMEHKTSGGDISAGSSYWDRVRTLDSQVSGYIDGARANGFDVEDCIYDVVAKPTIKPLKATPEEKRKYTLPKSRACKACKKDPGGVHTEMVDDVAVTCVDGRIVTDPGGRLHANMREEDETPEAFGERLRKDIEENPAEYFSRGPIVRLEADELRHRRDTWEMVRQMGAIQRPVHNRFACGDFGGCDFRRVCEGMADINDDTVFMTKEPRMQSNARGEG